MSRLTHYTEQRAKCIKLARQMLRDAQSFPEDKRFTKNMLDTAKSLLDISNYWKRQIQNETHRKAMEYVS